MYLEERETKQDESDKNWIKKYQQIKQYFMMNLTTNPILETLTACNKDSSNKKYYFGYSVNYQSIPIQLISAYIRCAIFITNSEIFWWNAFHEHTDDNGGEFKIDSRCVEFIYAAIAAIKNDVEV